MGNIHSCTKQEEVKAPKQKAKIKSKPKPQKIAKKEWTYAQKLIEKDHPKKIRRKDHEALHHSFIYVQGELYAVDCHAYIAIGKLGKVKFAQDKKGNKYILKRTSLPEGQVTREVACLLRAELLKGAISRKLFLHGATDPYEEKNYILIKYVKGHPLHKYLEDHKLSIQERYQIAYALIKALKELHAKGIIHGDIKPQNIIIRRHLGKFKIKFIDFGGSYILPENKNRVAIDELHFTPFYVDPYLIHGTPQQRDYYCFANDIYSLAKLILANLQLHPSILFETLEAAPKNRPSLDKLEEELKKREALEIALRESRQPMIFSNYIPSGFGFDWSSTASELDSQENWDDRYPTISLGLSRNRRP